MTPKNKAIELVDIYHYGLTQQLMLKDTKQCALIAVEEVLENCLECLEEYWQEVKNEIKKL